MKRLLIVFSVFSVLISSLSLPASAETVHYKWELISTYDAQTLYDNYSADYTMTLENGVATVTTRWWLTFHIFQGLDPTVTYRFELDPDLNGTVSYMLDGNTAYNSTTSNCIDISGVISFGFNRSNITPKSTSFRYANLYKRVPYTPFGTGGLAGDSSDLSHASSFLSNIFDGFWNLISQYWWVMALICMPLVYWIILLFVSFLKKSRSFTFKFWGRNKSHKDNLKDYDFKINNGKFSSGNYIKIDDKYYHPSNYKYGIFGKFKKGITRFKRDNNSEERRI